jgi:hypothetical protein
VVSRVVSITRLKRTQVWPTAFLHAT